MKKKLRNVVTLSLVFTLLVGLSTNCVVYANDEIINRSIGVDGVITSVVSDEAYDGWELQWEYSAGSYDVLQEIRNDTDSIDYLYDENNQRIEKRIDGISKVIYSYNESGQLITEQYENYAVSYTYANEEEIQAVRATGFVYNGEEYLYIYSSNLIVGIAKNNIEVAKYIYDGKLNTEVLELVDGEWVSNTEENFVGNINKLRYKGYYFDDETGWYYNGRYLDPMMNRFVDGINRNEAYKMIEQYGEEYTAEILLATNTFGLDMAEGEDAYNPNARSDEYSEIEVIARVLFAESGVIMDDQMAVANVMYNISQYRNWTVYYTVANKTRFAGYQSYLYYNPIQTSRLWSLAVNEATRLSKGYSPSWTPAGLTTQRNYRSVSYFVNRLSFSGGAYFFNGVRVYDIVICGYGVIDSYNLLTSEEIANLNGSHNIFFKYYNE